MSEMIGRRWLRFSLRTMFIVVTVLCCWLAWETHVVRERLELLKKLRADPAIQITTAAEWTQRNLALSPVPAAVKIPLIRRWLGDEAIQEIWYRGYGGGHSDPDRLRVAKVFPETKVGEVPLEPCHPGCFPRGTLVDTPLGPRPIESIQRGIARVQF